jgi:hypothetical protein
MPGPMVYGGSGKMEGVTVKREKRKIEFNFRFDFNLGGFISIRVGFIFWLGLTLNRYVMSYPNCK